MRLLGPTAILFSAVLLCAVPRLFADTITFEGLADGTPVTTQYPGFIFSHATVLTAGISLNEFDFPPHSGTNVVFDDGGPLSINFLTPMSSFGGYFTYSVPLTLEGFDLSNTLIASAVSAFSNNHACLAGPPCVGDPGSSPNEFLQLSFAGGISKVVITGDPGGSSFVMDDIGVPEPASISLVLTAAILVTCVRQRRLHNF